MDKRTIRNKLTTYIKTLPANTKMRVSLKRPEKAITKDTNKIITLTELQPSIILAIYVSLTINFIDGSSGCGTATTL